MTSILIAFSILIFTITTLYVIGGSYVFYFLPLLQNKIRDDFYKLFAVSLVAGFVLLTGFLSVFYTGFNTLFILPFISTLLPILLYKKPIYNEKLNLLFTTKQFYVVLILIVIIFSYNFIVYFRTNGYFFYDLVYYGKLSSGLIKYGIENPLVIYGNYILPEKQALYHYGDLWITGFISKVFHFSEVKSLVFVVYPLLHFIVLLLLISIYSIKGKITFWNLFLVFGLLYGIKFFLNIDFGNEVLNASKQYRGLPYPTSANKLLCAYILVLFSYLLYKLKLNKYSFIVFSITPIFYSVLVPSFAGVGFALILMCLIGSSFSLSFWDVKLNEVFYSLLGVLFILIYINKEAFETSDTLPLKLYSLKTYLVLFLETVVKVFLEYFILFLLLFYFVIKSKGIILFKPFVFIPLVSLFSGFLYIYIHEPGNFNLHQVISASSPIFLLILAIELFYFIEQVPTINKTLIVILVLSGGWNLVYFKQIKNEFGIRKTSATFSEKFSNRVEKYVSASKDKFISCTVRSIALNEFRDGDNSRWDYDFQNTFQDLYYSNKSPFPLEIGNLFSESNEIYSKTHPYYELYEDEKVTNSRIIAFLKRKKVDYIFVENEKIVPADFLVNFSLILKDNLTGSTFWKLKTI